MDTAKTQAVINALAEERNVKKRLRGLIDDSNTAHIIEWLLNQIDLRRELHAQVLDKTDANDAVAVGKLQARRDEDAEIKKFFDARLLNERIKELDNQISDLQSRLRGEALKKKQGGVDTGTGVVP